MPLALDNFISSRLADPAFEPEKPLEDRKSIALALGQKMIQDGVLSASLVDDALALVVFAQVNQGSGIEVMASADGRLLVFKNAVLARVETNSNGDDISTEGIDQLAATIAGTPIDIEHDADKNVGFYTAGRRKNDALAVDGVIWADRYPEAAEKVKNGTYLQSVEANALVASCSTCGEKFEDARHYCSHLKSRRKSGTKRHLSGLTARGGALTTRPAGSKTTFDPASVYFVASHQDSEIPMKCPKCKLEFEATVFEAHLEQEMGELQTNLDAAKAEQEKAVQAKVAAEANIVTANGERDAAKTAAETAKAEAETAKAATRRIQLKAHLSDEEWEKSKVTILGMADDAFGLLVGSYASRPSTAHGPLLVIASDDKAVEPLTL